METFRTTQKLNSILNIFALSCVSSDGLSLKTYWSLKNNLICIIVLTCAVSYKSYDFFSYRNPSAAFGLSDTKQIYVILCYFQYISELYFVYRYGRDFYIDYLERYNVIDEILGVSYCEDVFRNVNSMCRSCLCAALFASVVDFADHYIHGRWILLYLLDTINFFVKVFTILENTSSIIQIECRLRGIGDLLEADCNERPSDEVQLLQANMPVKNQQGRLECLSIFDSNKCNIVLWYSRCYLLLNEQTRRINTMYGFRFLGKTTTILMSIIMLVYSIITLTFNVKPVYIEGPKFFIFKCFVYLLSNYNILIHCLYWCEKCYQQCERIERIIDHTIINETITKELNDSLRTLKELIHSEPIHFHAYHFYKLDFSILISVTSVVFSYTVILLQNKN